MSNEKRARQKANREAKRAEEAKKAKRKHYFDLTKKYVGYALMFVVLLLIFRFFF